MIAAVVTSRTTITVSGYPPMLATAYGTAWGTLGTVSTNLDRAFTMRLEHGARPSFRRCGACHRICAPDEVARSRLGWAGYCRACTRPMLRACRVTNGRLPRKGECYCPRCRAIVPDAERAPRKYNGSAYMIACMWCYRAAARMRKARRKEAMQ